MPKKAASKSSMPSITPRARTYSGSLRSAWLTPASSVASSKKVMVSRPATRLAQNCSTSAAPGKRPAVPMSATASSRLRTGRWT
jgi:hypothetical protein